MLRKTAISLLAIIAFTITAAGQTNTSVDLTLKAVPSEALKANSLQQRLIVQPDGKVIVFRGANAVDGVAAGSIVRLNTDGSLDTSFTFCGCAVNYLERVILLPDGKLIISGSGNDGGMARLNSDGSLDAILISDSNRQYFVEASQVDGKVLVAVREAFSGFSRYDLFRYNADGSLDVAFSPIALTSGSPSFAIVGGIEFLPDGRFYLAVTSGIFTSSISLTRRNVNGTIDSSWEVPNFGSGSSSNSVNVAAIDLQADESLLVAGRFSTVNGVPKQSLVKLFPAGNVDLAFESPSVLWGTGVRSLPSGKILFAGSIDISGIIRLFRLNSDGSSDASFTMDTRISSILSTWGLSTSGQIIVFGRPTKSLNPRMYRLFADGDIDPSFDPNLTLFADVHAMVKQSDGKLVVAGTFSQMNGIARARIARVSADGMLDSTFDVGTGFNSTPTELISKPMERSLRSGHSPASTESRYHA